MKRYAPIAAVLYLVLVCVGVFLVREPAFVAMACAAQIVLWLALGLGFAALLRQIRKLATFAAFLLVCFAFSSGDPATDSWWSVGGVPVNVAGLAAGAWMVVRLVTVVLASQIVRAKDPRAVAEGLRRLGAPIAIAAPLDVVLALVSEGGGGRGNGGGGGRGRRNATAEGFRAALARLSRGDVGAIVERLDRHIDRAETHALASLPSEERGRAHDAGVIGGVALTMLGIRALKILPAIPFAPGHKLVILNPLYVVASMRTDTRAGGTLTGLCMGTASFTMGDGRYGAFEILKHVTPGIVCDLGLPLLVSGRRRPHPIVWSLFGGAIAAGRFATIFAVTLLVQPPAIAWAILVPGATVHVVFGILSGWLTHHLVRSLDTVRDRFPGASPPDPHGALRAPLQKSEAAQ